MYKELGAASHIKEPLHRKLTQDEILRKYHIPAPSDEQVEEEVYEIKNR
jgi:hypothetical protein